MKECAYRCVLAATALALLLVPGGTALALKVPDRGPRFDAKVIDNPVDTLDVASTPLASIAATEKSRGDWDQFRIANGGAWEIHLDRRSGAPLLVEGQGIALPKTATASIESVAISLRKFLGDNKALLLADDAELTFSPDASGPLQDDVWQVVFDRTIKGIPVEGERYMFAIGHGRLISFGAPRWSRINVDTIPALDSAEATDRMLAYMELTGADAFETTDKPKLSIIPVRAEGATLTPTSYDGPIGAGYGAALVWRIGLHVTNEPGNWVAFVDAHTGEIRAFYDDNHYARAKGGVYPVSDDQQCPDGCEQPNFPMPFANVNIGAGNFATTSSGVFSCTPAGATASTALSGPYIKVADTCGLVFQTTTCDTDLNLGTSGGIDCTVPSGSSGGNTHAARSSFYHLNRIAEHARSWLPSNNWVRSQVLDSVNLNNTCNAYWGGSSLNFFKSGGGCRNTGEIAGVFLHEWGHGLDQNDGGGFDNPSEAYADITSVISTHVSCMGRGFFIAGNCSGYGNACLNCSGIRELDWRKRADNVPSTPGGFVNAHCPSGAGPCGREVHCEGYIGGETIYDLGAHDLPDSGLDAASSWQLVDKLWYKSRVGSGGAAWNCSLPASDGCSVNSWFSKMRVIDDDDGNLANGTPHAAAIFAAFNRHGIACGTAASQSNQNSSSCPTIAAPTLSASIGNGSANLSWTPIANATGYRILRNDASCTAGSTVVNTVGPGVTSYSDVGLGNGFTEFYTIQAAGPSAACDGLLSNCVSATPQPSAGSVKFAAPSVSCNGTMNLTVIDSNIGGSTTSVTVVSTTESTPETVVLTQIAPGSDTYTGSIGATSAPPVHNGVLSVQNGDTVTANYIDASDGGGGINIPRNAQATADCVNPVISKVLTTSITGDSAKVTWSTNEAATSVVHSGTTPPPGTTTSDSTTVLAHGVNLLGLTECTPYVFSVDSADVVGNLATDNASGAYYAFTTGKSSQVSYSSTDTPVAIPDNYPLGATSTITPTDIRTVQDVNLTLNITHTFVADLTLYLITPAGQSIRLSTNRGGGGQNYTNTTFDDEAANPIGGSAPFTGTFRPESPLSVADGLSSGGGWGLKAVDNSSQDIGTIQNWTLQLTYAAPTCGPHAVLRSSARVSDHCVTGGPGQGNTYWDAGEHVQLTVNVLNDGTVPLTNVTAKVTPVTPGIVMDRDTAAFPTIPAGSAADSSAPNVTLHLPTSLACGSNASFQVAIKADQGSWSGTLVQAIGRPTNGTGRVLSEAFDAGIPATWTVLDGGTGGGAASKWTTNNPGIRTIAAPMFLPVATVDSDAAGPGAAQDESLLTPVLDLSTGTTATLQFDEFFRWYSGGLNELADIDVRSSLTGGNWVTVLSQQGASSANPAHKTLDVTAQAAGAPDAQIRFHDWNGSNELYWQVDNVTLDTSAPASCDMPVCAAPVPGGAKPVPDGSFGAVMRASRADIPGSTIALTWDVDLCASGGYHVLYGALGDVASMTPTGAACTLGTSGSASWAGVPGGGLWFVVVGDDAATTEASWGTDGTGAQRGGATPSGLCGLTVRDNTGVCP